MTTKAYVKNVKIIAAGFLKCTCMRPYAQKWAKRKWIGCGVMTFGEMEVAIQVGQCASTLNYEQERLRECEGHGVACNL